MRPTATSRTQASGSESRSGSTKRATAPRRARLRADPVVILTHTGAKTGGIRKNPIMRIPDGEAYVAVASAAGAATHPSWYFNLIAHPRAHVQDHAEHLDVIAREVHGAEKAAPVEGRRVLLAALPGVPGEGGGA